LNHRKKRALGGKRKGNRLLKGVCQSMKSSLKPSVLERSHATKNGEKIRPPGHKALTGGILEKYNTRSRRDLRFFGGRRKDGVFGRKASNKMGKACGGFPSFSDYLPSHRDPGRAACNRTGKKEKESTVSRKAVSKRGGHSILFHGHGRKGAKQCALGGGA